MNRTALECGRARTTGFILGLVFNGLGWSQAPDSQFPTSQVLPGKGREDPKYRQLCFHQETSRSQSHGSKALQWGGGRTVWKAKDLRPLPAARIPPITLGTSLPSVFFLLVKEHH